MLISQAIFHPNSCESLDQLRWAAGDNLYGHHQLLWTLFPGFERGKYSFLFHKLTGTSGPSGQRGLTFFILSKDLPMSDLPWWSISTKSYAPKIEAGDVFQFRLRANPTVAKPSGRKNKKGKNVSARHDVIMHRKKMEKSDGRPFDELTPMGILIQEEGLKWLLSRGSKNGFEVIPSQTVVQAYQQHDFGKTGRSGGMSLRLSTLEFEGVLNVIDAALFSKSLIAGIGPAKGFGCGLLLVK